MVSSADLALSLLLGPGLTPRFFFAARMGGTKNSFLMAGVLNLEEDPSGSSAQSSLASSPLSSGPGEITEGADSASFSRSISRPRVSARPLTSSSCSRSLTADSPEYRHPRRSSAVSGEASGSVRQMGTPGSLPAEDKSERRSWDLAARMSTWARTGRTAPSTSWPPWHIRRRSHSRWLARRWKRPRCSARRWHASVSAGEEVMAGGRTTGTPWG